MQKLEKYTIRPGTDEMVSEAALEDRELAFSLLGGENGTFASEARRKVIACELAASKLRNPRSILR